jgi:Putative auto-transporter adhesin, head GIN domain
MNVGKSRPFGMDLPMQLPMPWFCLAGCLALSSVALGCANVVHGNGQPASEVRPLEGFSAVVSAGSFDVKVEQRDTFLVRVDVDSNILPILRTRVSGGTLVIGSDEDVADLLPGPHVTIGMPRLTSATLSGSGRFSISGIQESEPVSLDLSGSGNVDFQGTAPTITARLGGSGEIDLAGSADSLVARLDGSGSVDARALPARVGSLDLGGSGDMVATVTERVDVSLRGSGHVDLFGGATLGQASTSGSGDIRRHE